MDGRSDGISIRQEVSPDGRLRLDFLPYPDPRTEHEATSLWGMDLHDAQTGAAIGSFGVVRHEWPAAGGIVLHEAGTALTIAPDLQSFTSAADGAARFPIGELAAWQKRRGEAMRRSAPPPPPAPKAGWQSWLALLAVIAVLGLFIASLPPVRRALGAAIHALQ